jgi:hypothetical protein
MFTFRCRFVPLALAAPLIVPSIAQESRADEASETVALLHDWVDSFFRDLDSAEVKPADAFAGLLKGSRLAKQTGAVKKLVEQTNKFETQFGKFVSAERIKAQQVGKDLVLMTYLYKCEHYPVVWYFTFYRGNTSTSTTNGGADWSIIGIRFDTKLDALRE